MICAVHAVVGAAVGKFAGNYAGAFAAGVATHLIGDLLPHKDFHPKTEAPLLAATLGLIALRFGVRSPEFAGAMGGIAPDFENAAAVTGLIPREKMRFPTHRGEDKHGPKLDSAWSQAVLVAACAAYLLRPSSSGDASDA